MDRPNRALNYTDSLYGSPVLSAQQQEPPIPQLDLASGETTNPSTMDEAPDVAMTGADMQNGSVSNSEQVCPR
jgi:hypothetical protein